MYKTKEQRGVEERRVAQRMNLNSRESSPSHFFYTYQREEEKEGSLGVCVHVLQTISEEGEATPGLEERGYSKKTTNDLILYA